MATAVQISDLRSLINEPDATHYTDQTLSDRIDLVNGDLYPLASQIWREKAARYAGLIDVQEGSSNRKMSQLYQNALSMASSLLVSVDGAAPTRRARTRPIERM